MQYNTLLTRIAADIYSNGAELITGDILQNVLNDMVGALASAGACYKGTITPASAAPLDLDQPTVYLALTAGTYTNFVDSNNDPIVTTGPALITYDGGASLVFSKTDLPFATTSDLPWRSTVTPDEPYLDIFLNDGCVLAIDSVGDNTFHGIVCVDNVEGITAAVFVGACDIDTSLDVQIGRNVDNGLVLEITTNAGAGSPPITVTCLDGTAPDHVEYNAVSEIDTISDSLPWTELGAGGGGGAAGAVRYDESQSLTDAQKLQARTNIGAAKEKETLILDQTFTLERLQPIAYDSGTGYYEVTSFPSWVTANNGEDFYACLNVVDFSAANAVPWADGNADSTLKLTKVDSTHFSMLSANAPSGTPNVNAFFFTENNIIIPFVGIPNAKTKYRLIVDNGNSSVCKYFPLSINCSSSKSQTQGYVMPKGIYAGSFSPIRPMQSYFEYEFIIDSTPAQLSDYTITAHKLTGGMMGKSNASTFASHIIPTTYGDNTIKLWGINGFPNIYIHPYQANSHNVVKDGTRVRLYIIND